MACSIRTSVTGLILFSALADGEPTFRSINVVQCELKFYRYVRICPGRYFALESIFVTIACTLHVFDITPPLDDNGVEIKIEPRMVDSLVT